MNEEKWTIRGVEEEALDKIFEVKNATGIPYGRLVTAAIHTWYETLDEADPVPPFRVNEWSA